MRGDKTGRKGREQRHLLNAELEKHAMWSRQPSAFSVLLWFLSFPEALATWEEGRDLGCQQQVRVRKGQLFPVDFFSEEFQVEHFPPGLHRKSVFI